MKRTALPAPSLKPHWRWNWSLSKWWLISHHAARIDASCVDCGEYRMISVKGHRCVECSIARRKRLSKISGPAHHEVQKAIRAGKLSPLDGTTKCVDCGRSATDYDHRSYAKPLEVEPVCTSCNLKRGPAIEIRQLGKVMS